MTAALTIAIVVSITLIVLLLIIAVYYSFIRRKRANGSIIPSSLPFLPSNNDKHYFLSGRRSSKHRYSVPNSPYALTMWNMILSLETTQEEIKEYREELVTDIILKLRSRPKFTLEESYQDFKEVLKVIEERNIRVPSTVTLLSCREHFARVRTAVDETMTALLREKQRQEDDDRYRDSTSFNHYIAIFLINTLTSSSSTDSSTLICKTTQYSFVIILEYINNSNLDAKLKLALVLALSEFITNTLLHDQILYLSKYLSNVFTQIKKLLCSSSSFAECRSKVEKNYGAFFTKFLVVDDDSASASASASASSSLSSSKTKKRQSFQTLHTLKETVEDFLTHMREEKEDSAIIKSLLYIISRKIDTLEATRGHSKSFMVALNRLFIFLSYEAFSLYGLPYDPLFSKSMIEFSFRQQFNFYLPDTASLREKVKTNKLMFDNKVLRFHSPNNDNNYFSSAFITKAKANPLTIVNFQLFNILKLIATPMNVYEQDNHITTSNPIIEDSVFSFFKLKDPFLDSSAKDYWTKIKKVSLCYLVIASII